MATTSVRPPTAGGGGDGPSRAPPGPGGPGTGRARAGIRWALEVRMAEPLLPERLERYLESLVPPRAAELAEMEQEGRRTNFPIIGPACGHFCYLTARLIGARQGFEMGSGYGYSTAWFARAAPGDGGGGGGGAGGG